MSVPVENLHDALLNQTNQVNGEYLTNLTTVQRDFYLNEAKDLIITHLVRRAEKDPEAESHLREITIREKELTLKPGSDNYIIAEFPEDYHRDLRRSAIATCPGCEERVLVVRRIKSDKLDVALKNPDLKPSFKYEETLAIQGSEGLHVYFDGFEIKKVFLDYVRRVKDVRAPRLATGKYELPTGEQLTENVDFEIDAPYLVNTIPRIAAAMVLNDNREDSDYQSKLQEILGFKFI